MMTDDQRKADRRYRKLKRWWDSMTPAQQHITE